MAIDWERALESLRSLGDRKENFLLFLLDRTVAISESLDAELSTHLEGGSGASARCALEPLRVRFRAYSRAKTAFELRLGSFTNSVKAVEDKRRAVGSTPELGHGQVAVVMRARADLLQLAVDEVASSTEAMLDHHRLTRPAAKGFTRESALEFIFNGSEIMALLTPGVDHIVHFAGPVIDAVRKLILRFSDQEVRSPLKASMDVLDNLDALAEAMRLIVVGVYRLPCAFDLYRPTLRSKEEALEELLLLERPS